MKRCLLLLFVILSLLMIGQNLYAWIGLTRLTWTTGESKYPDVAIEAGIFSNNIHMVYSEYVNPGNYEIFYKKSTDGGITWSGSKRLTWMAGTSDSPTIAIDKDNNIHIAWQDNNSGYYEIYYKKSVDGGNTWTGAKRLTWSESSSLYPDILARPMKLNNGAVIVGLHITWSGLVGTNFEIFHKSSNDDGQTWDSPHIKRVTWNSGYSWFSKIAVDSKSRLHLVWQDSSPGNYEIFYKISEDGGNAWTMERLTWNPGWSANPSIATDPSDNIYLVWEDDTFGNFEIMFKGHDGITTWSLPSRLTWTPGDSYSPTITAFSTMQPHLVWYGDHSGNNEIYYKASSNGGNTWPGATRLTWNSGYSYVPVVAVDYTTLNVHVFWADNTPGNYEIYYKKKN